MGNHVLQCITNYTMCYNQQTTVLIMHSYSIGNIKMFTVATVYVHMFNYLICYVRITAAHYYVHNTCTIYVPYSVKLRVVGKSFGEET